jgi:hypothetical protein
MAKTKRMTDDKLKAIVDRQLSDAKPYDGDERQRQREWALRFFEGEVDIPAMGEGRSTVVSRDVSDTHGLILPGLLRIFFASENVVVYEPTRPEHEAYAQQATSFKDGMFTMLKEDEKWDGYKALSTTTNLKPEEVIEKYSDLFEVEHAFRSLKSQLQIRPIYHWTDKRIEGHIAMCFMAYTMLNHLRTATSLTEKEIVRTLDKMQLSEIKEKNKTHSIYIRSNQCHKQKKILEILKLPAIKDTNSKNTINQLFTPK